jgi:hypothetical protein
MNDGTPLVTQRAIDSNLLGLATLPGRTMRSPSREPNSLQMIRVQLGEFDS